ncbi:MAG: substrate-binding domain-containing protein, partial [Verrucomicrobia bacterium]|nr:substrate-binding domain-containing protein [Verrucomicrobiota bacterium]
MANLRVLSVVEQVAAYLRGELLRGRWSDVMPGGDWVAGELGIARRTAEAALRLLEREGLLVGRGARCRRRIKLPEGNAVVRPLRVALLDYEPLRLADGCTLELQHLLNEAGHTAFFTKKCLLDLRMDVKRIARMVEKTSADAWVVGAGSREVLEWFAAQPVPAFAWCGRRRGLPIAGVGPDLLPPLLSATRRLIELGHRRVVNLVRQERRDPVPGHLERVILDELAAHDISTGPYNIPNWDDTGKGFQACLHGLFLHTPPTALIVNEVPLFFAAMQFLMNRGLRVPQDVSLLCSGGSPIFEWSEPTVTHIRWDTRP